MSDGVVLSGPVVPTKQCSVIGCKARGVVGEGLTEVQHGWAIFEMCGRHVDQPGHMIGVALPTLKPEPTDD